MSLKCFTRWGGILISLFIDEPWKMIVHHSLRNALALNTKIDKSIDSFEEQPKDKVMNCKNCGREFYFTVSEQQFYAQKGFENEPQRCKICRDERKRMLRNFQT